MADQANPAKPAAAAADGDVVEKPPANPASEDGKKQELSELEGSEEFDSVKDDILAALPDVGEVAKPEQVAPRNADDEKYFDEHDGLPIEEERPMSEVLEDEKTQIAERAKVAKEIEEESDDVGTLSTTGEVTGTQPENKSDELLEVESILEEGLEGYFDEMTPEQQTTFKQQGEVTASSIVILLQSAKVQLVKVVELIKNWLKLIPGVNTYFLEQESKIKTDELIKIKQDKEGEKIM